MTRRAATVQACGALHKAQDRALCLLSEIPALSP